ncbi:O-antigen ligase family protein [Lacticaseibacillus rhamnosus]|uniref:O-antigen ligase family protein n=1 Tax=Lacticaseibacillus rhamnosus TaxID=47715 RepID=UPI0029167FBE|nr:O-antigen ligase family protein [Lacticaseibacillus rhamnosus]WNX02625.1 O-antigen ligase family protein [Lacticaseibacillus rhamnosus]
MESSKRLVSFFEFYLSIMLIMSFRTVWLYTEDRTPSRIVTAATIISIVALIAAYIVFCSPSLLTGDLVIIMVVSTGIIISMIVSTLNGNGQLLTRHLSYFALLILLFLSYRAGRLNLLIKHFITVCCFLAACSLFFWILAIIGVPMNSTLYISWASKYYEPIKGFFGLFYFSQDFTSFLGFYLPRNTAIFTEAPMCSFLFCLGLIFDIFIGDDDKKHKLGFREILLIVGIISTTSTTGIMIVILTLVANLFRTVKINPLVVTVGVMLSAFVLYILWQIFLAKTTENSNSVSIRFDDLHAGIKAWLLHPFFGNGLENTLAYLPFIQGYRVVEGGNSGFSSGLLQILMTGGVFYFIWIVFIPLAKMFFKSRSYLFLGLIFLIMLINTVIYDTFMMFFISALFYAVTLRKTESQVA